MFPLLKDDEENTLELFQIWLNLPKAGKFADPHFRMLWNEDIPVVEEQNAKIKVIAGAYKNVASLDPAPDSWAADPKNEVAIWNIHARAASEYVLPKANTAVNRVLYFYDGNHIHIEDKKINPNFGIVLDPSRDVNIKIGSETAHFMLLQGKPIGEPVAKYGPFVMNTQAEIQKAMEEYRLTQFGGWPWPYPDHVHEKNRGRFALYPDGNLEKK
jgi:redox-sensitive bicupin YhaK (pirin superfamily)